MKNILDYLERTTVCNAWKTAVDDGNICMTWLELQEMSKSIGTALCKRTGRQKPVVILAEKSAVTLAAMFGVVYAGCFYVMVDPKQPIERLCEIFHTLLPEIIIIPAENEALLEQTGYGECKCLLKDIMKEQIDERQLLAVRKACTADDLLYGIFTSGSTGVPKGIVVSHKSVINFITHFIHTFQFAETDVIGNQAPFDFDVSVKDIYTCLMTGAALVIIPTKLFSVPPVLLDYLCNKHVNTLIWAVSALTLISALHGLKYRIPIEVKRVMFSGEVMPVKQLNYWREYLPDAMYANLFGPTETTDICTYYVVDREFADDEPLPMGHACNNCDVFVLDENGREVSPEIDLETGFSREGELYARGSFVALGYFGNAEKTREAFVQNPLNPYYPELVYKTGDLVKYNRYGELVYVCRKDYQIKHMGYRIELGEIEAAAGALGGIRSYACIYDDAADKIVFIYEGKKKDETELLKAFQERVPHYMEPNRFVRVTSMPHNANGKIDRKRLKAEYAQHV